MHARGRRSTVWLVALLLTLAGVLLLLLRSPDQETPLPGNAERGDGQPSQGPVLDAGTGQGRIVQAEARPGEKPVPGADAPQVPTGYVFRIRDYRGLTVEGVQVFIERDSVDLKTWSLVSEGVTDRIGEATFAVPGVGRRQPQEGLNFRIRVVPPSERDDLAATWRLWTPVPTTQFDFTETFVVVGQVLDADGRSMAGAKVGVGDLRPADTVNPAWFTGETDASGRFKIAGIPKTPDGLIDVWAARAGGTLPERLSEAPGAVRVALGDRAVVLRVP